MGFIATAMGRDGGASYRRGKDRADAELAVDVGATTHRLRLAGFIGTDGAAWVRIVFDGRELACAPFLQIADEVGAQEDNAPPNPPAREYVALLPEDKGCPVCGGDSGNRLYRYRRGLFCSDRCAYREDGE